MVKTYNVNELLSRKKQIETQISEVLKDLDIVSLQAKKEIFTITSSGKERENIISDKVSIDKFQEKFRTLNLELMKIKKAVLKYNAEFTKDLIFDRELARNEITYFKILKDLLPKNKSNDRKVSREDREGNALEYIESICEPMFDKNDIEKRLDQACAEERKANTELQLLNLTAKIELE